MASGRDPSTVAEGQPLLSASDINGDKEDSFHLSGDSSNLWLNSNKVFPNSSCRYSSLSLSPENPVDSTAVTTAPPVPLPVAGPPTGLKRVLLEREVDEEVVSMSPSMSSRGSEAESSCMQCFRRFPRQIRSAQRHRRCPHTFRICLVFFMFILLGIAERGCFVVLFYLLNSQFYLEPGETITIHFTVRFFIYVMYPVTGFMADAVFGHYKVIRGCLCIAWLGSAFMAIGFAIYEFSQCSPTEHCWVFSTRMLTGIGYTIFGIGLTGIRVNLIPFGADQMPDASGGELSSYFHWYYFCITLGHLIAVIILPPLFKFSSFAYVFLTIATAITVLLGTFLIFQYQWLILPKRGNSLRLVYDVVKFSFFSRRPMKKSAFDVGMPKPSWMDKAMIKYGGTYTLEQVEGVKTFFRILTIVASCIGYYAVFSQVCCSIWGG